MGPHPRLFLSLLPNFRYRLTGVVSLLLGVAIFSASTTTFGALALSTSVGLTGKSSINNIRSISSHDGRTSFNQVTTRAEALATVEAQLLDTLMEDPTIGDMIKDVLKGALGSLTGALSSAAKESCERLKKEAEEKIEEAHEDSSPDSVSQMLDEIDKPSRRDDDSFIQHGNNALVNLQDEGFFDSIKEKAKSAFSGIKKAAKSMMAKLAEKLKPILEKAIAQILPRLRKQAAGLLSQACTLADKKLDSLNAKFNK